MVDEKMALPRLDLLCYHSASPMLRVVDPGAGEQRPFSDQKTFGQAVHLALARDGWLAGWAGYTYRFLLTETAKPKRLQRSWPFVASNDRRCIWIPNRETWNEYDGVTDDYHREVTLDDSHLVADTAQGLLITAFDGTVRLVDRHDPITELRRWSSHGNLVAVRGSTLVWGDAANQLRVEHLDTGTTVSIALPLWRLHGTPAGPASFSPDARRLALTGDAIVGPVPFDIPRKQREKRKRQGSGLVIVDLIDGSAELVDGYFENTAYRPVWTADGEWIFFGAPFENAMYAVAVDEPRRRLQRVYGVGRSAPMPILDLACAHPDTPSSLV